jgi:hypothetical protein
MANQSGTLAQNFLFELDLGGAPRQETPEWTRETLRHRGGRQIGYDGPDDVRIPTELGPSPGSPDAIRLAQESAAILPQLAPEEAVRHEAPAPAFTQEPEALAESPSDFPRATDRLGLLDSFNVWRENHVEDALYRVGLETTEPSPASPFDRLQERVARLSSDETRSQTHQRDQGVGL